MLTTEKRLIFAGQPLTDLLIVSAVLSSFTKKTLEVISIRVIKQYGLIDILHNHLNVKQF